jgi:hypothetical protein
MDRLSSFAGDLFCKIPLGVAQCSSDRILVGKCVIVAGLVLVAFFFLMRNSRRA